MQSLLFVGLIKYFSTMITKYLRQAFDSRLYFGSFLMLSFISPAAKAEEILIACEYENKVFMSIVDTSRSGLQRVFGHNAYVTQHKAGFLRISIQMDVESRDIIFSERSGAMSYNSGEIDQNVSCRLEELTNAAMNVPEEMPDQGKHDYLWYFNQHGIEMSYTTDEP